MKRRVEAAPADDMFEAELWVMQTICEVRKLELYYPVTNALEEDWFSDETQQSYPRMRSAIMIGLN